ncbi:LytR/AlgR family response regulator transcription factor [Anaerocolumna xylanovorans]|uniref:Stage 0 sporulation protein A homolog n=1 Tax=Anaerocolumna xylanovorans DSM 12503 TaxID=1121345 RepID=A0A1M7YID3_9FIRM|nr:LytTR family DNA-binding domain-containing protein [Anaerocolumna xylanovorans]SHO52339.1 two component transcriptional regulator, LytTR family [Anaerocolumna xylanovorans DSM 12503]
MMKFISCDDEEEFTEQIKRLIADFCENHYIEYNIETYNNGYVLLKNRLDFDIAFIDIHMVPINGVNLAKEIRKHNKDCKIVFVTNFDDYHNHAFEVHAFGYITKPIDKEKFNKLLHDAVIVYNNRNEISIKLSSGLLNIDPDNILYIEYIERKTQIHTSSEIYTSTLCLRQLYYKLKMYDFAYCHKSFLINLNQIRFIKGFEIELKNSGHIPLAQKKAAQFKRDYFKFLHQED